MDTTWKSKNKDTNFHIISMATYGHGLSGGDRIWIELAKRIGKIFPVSIYVWEEGMHIAQRENLKGVNYVLWSSKIWVKLGFIFNYFARIIISVIMSFRLRIKNSPNTIVYSASEFWQDSLPALILKLRFPEIKWVASWYQTAPNPFRGFSEKGTRDDKHYLNAILYWLVQKPIKPIIQSLANIVVVNNEQERKRFPKFDKNGNIFVMLGAVRLDEIEKYIKQKAESKKLKVYDAVFQGRFHPQKGVVELVQIWRNVVDERRDAILAMIGDGPLMKDVRLKIKDLKLEKNVKLFGYVFDGDKKYRIFSQSKIVVHPAYYDSGGMASSEAMAFDIPCVGFDLDAYRSYYPEGMVKVPVGNISLFSDAILNLLANSRERVSLGRKAGEMIRGNWSWDNRADQFLLKVI